MPSAARKSRDAVDDTPEVTLNTAISGAQSSTLVALDVYARDFERKGDHASRATLHELIVLAGSLKAKAAVARMTLSGDVASLVDAIYEIF